MKANAIAAIVVLSSVCSSRAAQVLPFGREQAASEAFAAIRLQAMDDAAERGWLSLGSRAEYDSMRSAMRAKMLAAMGTFPERTSLNPVVRATYEREGYRVEKVVFWSMCRGILRPVSMYTVFSRRMSLEEAPTCISCLQVSRIHRFSSLE